MVNSAGIISTFAGSGSSGSSGDGSSATSAYLKSPTAVAWSLTSGSLYIADSGNCRIRMISPSGIITTIAGTSTNPVSGYSGDNGPATLALLSAAWGLTVDMNENVYISDSDNHVVRQISSSGIITTYAGTGTAGNSGNGGAAASAQLYTPIGVAVDSSGKLYIADFNSYVVRAVFHASPTSAPTPAPTTSAPTKPTQQPTSRPSR